MVSHIPCAKFAFAHARIKKHALNWASLKFLNRFYVPVSKSIVRYTCGSVDSRTSIKFVARAKRNVLLTAVNFLNYLSITIFENYRFEILFVIRLIIYLVKQYLQSERFFLNLYIIIINIWLLIWLFQDLYNISTVKYKSVFYFLLQ